MALFNKPDQGGGKISAPESGKSGAKPIGSVSAKADSNLNFSATTTGPSSRTGGALASAVPEMMAYEVELLPLLQEIAVLYAANEMDATQALLQKTVQSKTPHPQAWLMLLDLYKARGMKKEFEDLAMTYTVKFESSPPTWNEQGNQPEARKESRQASDFYSFPGKDLPAEVKKLSEMIARLSSARVEVGKIKAIDPHAAESLANVLVDARKGGLPVRFNNLNPFIELLKKTIAENLSKEYSGVWQLLFELYQRQGMQSEFEDLGLEYAMGFEMSPPSWEAVAVEQAADAESEPAGDSGPAAADGFPLRGCIALDNLGQVQQLINHAAAQKEVHVNMAGLQRIDFSAVGLFIEALSKIQASGKKTVLIDVNELIFPLLEAFGASRLALLLRRKAQ